MLLISLIFQKLLRGPKYPALENPVLKNYHVPFDLDMNGHVNNSSIWTGSLSYGSGLPYKKYIPKKINLKYVQEVRPGGMIAASDLEGLQSNHQFSDGGVLSGDMAGV